MKRVLQAVALLFLWGATAHGEITSILPLPAGSDTYLQYNDNGLFGAEAALTYDDSTNKLTVSSVTATWISASSMSITSVSLPSVGSNEVAYSTGGAIDGESAFTYNSVTDVLTVPSIAVTTATVSSGTITNANIGSLLNDMNANEKLINNVATATLAHQVPRFSQINPLTVSTATVSSDFSTTSTSFIATALTSTVTIKSAASLVNIRVSGTLSTGTNGETIRASLYRGDTNLGGTLGFTGASVSGATIVAPLNIVWQNAALSAGPTTYTLRVLSAGGGTVALSCNGRPCFMIVEEISGQ